MAGKYDTYCVKLHHKFFSEYIVAMINISRPLANCVHHQKMSICNATSFVLLENILDPQMNDDNSKQEEKRWS